jgi:hypothetical protein
MEQIPVTAKQRRQHLVISSHGSPPDTSLSNLNAQIDDCAAALSRRLHFPEKQIARILCYWSKRVPLDEREDLIQGLTLKALQESPPSLRLAFCVLKRDTQDYLRRYYTHARSNLSLSAPTIESKRRALANGDETYTLGELIPDTFEFDAVVQLKLDTARLLAEMDSETQQIVGRKLCGVRLTRVEKAKLEQWATEHRELVYA